MFKRKDKKEKDREEKERDRATLNVGATRGASNASLRAPGPAVSVGNSPSVNPHNNTALPVAASATKLSEMVTPDMRKPIEPLPPSMNHVISTSIASHASVPETSTVSRPRPEPAVTAATTSPSNNMGNNTIRGKLEESSKKIPEETSKKSVASPPPRGSLPPKMNPNFDLNKLESFRESISKSDVQNISVSVPSSLKEKVKREQLYKPREDFDLQRFQDFQNLLVELSNHVDVDYKRPEIVIVGATSVGKSHVMEAIVGEPMNLVEFNKAGATRRPLFIHLVNSSADKKYSFEGREAQSKTLSKIPANKSKNNTITNRFISDPVSVQMESKYYFDFSIVDTPGLSLGTDIIEKPEYMPFLEHLLRPAHRHILLVEDSIISATSSHHISSTGGEPIIEDTTRPYIPGVETLRQLVRRCDPSGARTTVVYNKFLSTLSYLPTEKRLQRFFTTSEELFNDIPKDQIFYTSLLSGKEREQAISDKKTNSSAFMDKLLSNETQEIKILKYMNCSDSFLERVGLSKLRHHLVQKMWQQYQREIVPGTIRIIQNKRRETLNEMRNLESVASRKQINLKELVAKFASRYAQISVELIHGTSKVHPDAVGETLKEEVDEQYFSTPEWRMTDVNNLSLSKVRIYGGQQFQRLFSEFEALCGNLVVPSKLLAGLPSQTDKNFFFHACELCKDRAEDTIIVLIDQLHERLLSVFNRLPGLIETIIKKENEHKFPLDVKYFRRLCVYLRTLVTAYADKLIVSSKKHCMDEFYPTKTIMYEVLNVVDENEAPILRFAEERDMVQEIFKRMRTRIAKNVIRKVHNFFLAPIIDNELWLELQSTISTLDSSAISEVLDAGMIREEMENNIVNLKSTADKMSVYDRNIMTLAL